MWTELHGTTFTAADTDRQSISPHRTDGFIYDWFRSSILKREEGGRAERVEVDKYLES